MELKMDCPKCGQHLAVDNPSHLSYIECPDCGAFICFYDLNPGFKKVQAVVQSVNQPPSLPPAPRFKGYRSGVFLLSISELLSAITSVVVSEYGYTVTISNENMVTFETGMNMFSWSGMTGTIVIQKLGENEYKLIGSGKQNIRGGQLGTIGGTGAAIKKVKTVIDSVATYVNRKFGMPIGHRTKIVIRRPQT